MKVNDLPERLFVLGELDQKGELSLSSFHDSIGKTVFQVWCVPPEPSAEPSAAETITYHKVGADDLLASLMKTVPDATILVDHQLADPSLTGQHFDISTVSSEKCLCLQDYGCVASLVLKLRKDDLPSFVRHFLDIYGQSHSELSPFEVYDNGVADFKQLTSEFNRICKIGEKAMVDAGRIPEKVSELHALVSAHSLSLRGEHDATTITTMADELQKSIRRISRMKSESKRALQASITEMKSHEETCRDYKSVGEIKKRLGQFKTIRETLIAFVGDDGLLSSIPSLLEEGKELVKGMRCMAELPENQRIALSQSHRIPSCTKCGESNWEVLSASPSGKASQWKCSYCGKETLLRHDKETDSESSESNSRAIPKAVQREVWQRDQGKCVECGSKEKLEYDHIIPVSKGGSNTARNIQLLCENCNRSKGASIGG